MPKLYPGSNVPNRERQSPKLRPCAPKKHLSEVRTATKTPALCEVFPSASGARSEQHAQTRYPPQLMQRAFQALNPSQTFKLGGFNCMLPNFQVMKRVNSKTFKTQALKTRKNKSFELQTLKCSVPIELSHSESLLARSNLSKLDNVDFAANFLTHPHSGNRSFSRKPRPLLPGRGSLRLNSQILPDNLWSLSMLGIAQFRSRKVLKGGS